MCIYAYRLFQRGYIYSDIVLTKLFQYYNKYTGLEDPCQGLLSANCQRDQIAFIDAISDEGGEDGPIHVLHRWLNQSGGRIIFHMIKIESLRLIQSLINLS